MVIMFDGPDRVGKTHMAIELSRRLDVPRFKNKQEHASFLDQKDYFENAMVYTDPYFASYLKQTGASVIMDRGYPSEYCYSKAFNRKTNDRMLCVVDELFADIGTKIIIPYRTSYAGLSDDKFSVINSDMLMKLDKLYEQFAVWTKCSVLRVCVDDEDIEREMNEIIPFIMDR